MKTKTKKETIIVFPTLKLISAKRKIETLNKIIYKIHTYRHIHKGNYYFFIIYKDFAFYLFSIFMIL